VTDLQVVCALQFADRVTNATAGEAGRVIRERLADVGSECRRILREALDDVEASPSTAELRGRSLRREAVIAGRTWDRTVRAITSCPSRLT
jgi:hypothetical protein